MAGGADAFVTASETIAHHVERATGLVRTCNAGLPREVALAIPFDERFPAAAAEDRDWCARLVAAGVRIVREPRARVRHLADPGAVAFGRQHLRYGRAAARHGRTAAGGGSFYRELVQAASGKDSSPVDSFSPRRSSRRPGMRSRRCGRSRRLGWAVTRASESEFAVVGAGPGRADVRLRPRAARRRRPSCSRRTTGRRDRQDRRVRRATASTSAGTASSRSSRPVQRLWEDMLGGDFLTRPTPLPHLLPRASTSPTRSGEGRRGPPRLRRGGAAARSRTSGRGAPRAKTAETFEELGRRSRFGRRLYDAFFRDVHREGLGRSRAREIRARMGRPADQELLALERRPHDRCGLEPRARDDAHRGVPLPAARARPDVGGRSARARRASAGIPVAARRALRRRFAIATAAVDSIVVECGGGHEREFAVDERRSRASRSASSSLGLDPPAPDDVRDAARPAPLPGALSSSRSCSTDPEPFPDNWIYLHDPGTRAGPRAELRRLERGHGRARGRPASGSSTSASRATTSGSSPSHDAIALATRRARPDRARRPAPASSAASRSTCRRRIRCTTPRYRGRPRRHPAPTSHASRTSRPAAATASTATTTRITRCWTAVARTLNLLDDAGYDVWSRQRGAVLPGGGAAARSRSPRSRAAGGRCMTESACAAIPAGTEASAVH